MQQTLMSQGEDACGPATERGENQAHTKMTTRRLGPAQQTLMVALPGTSWPSATHMENKLGTLLLIPSRHCEAWIVTLSLLGRITDLYLSRN
jgi:hypothetical protein